MQAFSILLLKGLCHVSLITWSIFDAELIAWWILVDIANRSALILSIDRWSIFRYGCHEMKFISPCIYALVHTTSLSVCELNWLIAPDREPKWATSPLLGENMNGGGGNPCTNARISYGIVADGIPPQTLRSIWKSWSGCIVKCTFGCLSSFWSINHYGV